jgi:hypothetical protein
MGRSTKDPRSRRRRAEGVEIMKTGRSKERFITDADTGEKIVFYECDPEKNKDCGKLICKHSGLKPQFGICDITNKAEYRADEGRAFYIRCRHKKPTFERVYINEEGGK